MLVSCSNRPPPLLHTTRNPLSIMPHTHPHSAPLLHSGSFDADHSISMPIMGFHAAGASNRASYTQAVVAIARNQTC